MFRQIVEYPTQLFPFDISLMRVPFEVYGNIKDNPGHYFGYPNPEAYYILFTAFKCKLHL